MKILVKSVVELLAASRQSNSCREVYHPIAGRDHGRQNLNKLDSMLVVQLEVSESYIGSLSVLIDCNSRGSESNKVSTKSRFSLDIWASGSLTDTDPQKVS